MRYCTCCILSCSLRGVGLDSRISHRERRRDLETLYLGHLGDIAGLGRSGSSAGGGSDVDGEAPSAANLSGEGLEWRM